MNKVLYEISWHSSGDVFSHCTVSPITLLREGVLPGCSAVSITAIDSDGRKFQGSPGNYYITEEYAWEAVKAGLVESIEAHEKQISDLQIQLLAQRHYLNTIMGGNDD